jgi:hypothetical protein
MPHFDEDTIQKLFGNEAAENETLARLREYYVKSDVYERMLTVAPLRVLVGHKGIGKSALITVAMNEARDRSEVCALVKPDDIVEVASEDKPLNVLIRDWKSGLSRILAAKLLESLGAESKTAKLVSGAGKLIELVAGSIQAGNVTLSLDPAKKALAEAFMKQRRLTVYLDDLDRGWEGKPSDIKRISALLNAVRDLSSDNEGLAFRVALRSDVYYLVRTSDESTDKIENSVIWYSWENHEILVLLIKRIETFLGRPVDEKTMLKQRQRDLAHYLEPVFSSNFEGQGKWENAQMYRVLMSLVRKRPRDLVKLCTAAAREAARDKSDKIHSKHLQAVFEEYSQGRIQDTINEYRTELHEIERLLMGMKPNKKEREAKLSYFYPTDALLKKIENIMQGGRFVFASGRVATSKELARFLYKINFLIATKAAETGYIDRRYFEESRYLSGEFADFGYGWEVHPAYRWALQPDSLPEIFEHVGLSSDDG